ncbi:hypothetical protein [Ahrensia sp. 13_GOM-1096m]|uniref:hypothetical protein n=1 Tax=Ahrensia sp. 13_GOM-1096m TaxID=1380380 RepID=UPI00047CA45B|nr:hypothetical protein [Ahrensia sp. 13_GOM-1096m]
MHLMTRRKALAALTATAAGAVASKAVAEPVDHAALVHHHLTELTKALHAIGGYPVEASYNLSMENGYRPEVHFTKFFSDAPKPNDALSNKIDNSMNRMKQIGSLDTEPSDPRDKEIYRLMRPVHLRKQTEVKITVG